MLTFYLPCRLGLCICEHLADILGPSGLGASVPSLSARGPRPPAAPAGLFQPPPHLHGGIPAVSDHRMIVQPWSILCSSMGGD